MQTSQIYNFANIFIYNVIALLYNVYKNDVSSFHITKLIIEEF